MRVSTLLCLSLFLGACASVSPTVTWVFPVTTAQAIFLWKYNEGSLVGDAFITSDSRGNVMIRLNKNLPQPLLEITSTVDGKCRVDGPMSGGGWSGVVERVPQRFSLWTALAAAWRGSQLAKEGRQEVHTATYRAAVWKETGRIRELSVSSNDNGEVVRLIFR